MHVRQPSKSVKIKHGSPQRRSSTGGQTTGSGEEGAGGRPKLAVVAFACEEVDEEDDCGLPLVTGNCSSVFGLTELERPVTICWVLESGEGVGAATAGGCTLGGCGSGAAEPLAKSIYYSSVFVCLMIEFFQLHVDKNR